MNDNKQPIKSSSIRDIPQIAENLNNVKNLATVKKTMPFCRPFLKILGIDTQKIDEALVKVDNLIVQMKEISEIPDRFNNIFASRGWVIYELLELEVVKNAVKKAESGDVDGAEIDLVDYYSVEKVRWHLQAMNAIHAFFPRTSLAQKAVIDYEAERYHACVPVVLALLDGLVNELQEKRRGFFAEEVDLKAWDSISAHEDGLNKLVKTFSTSRNKLTTEQIPIPYRNGIMHGMDLGYDNKMVAAKTWAALFAIRDWALKAEKGLLKSQPKKQEKTWKEIINQSNQNKKTKEQLEQWKPRTILIGTNEVSFLSEGTPERKLATYLNSWIKKNYGQMAQCISLPKDCSIKKAPSLLRNHLSSKNLKSFEFISIKDSAPAMSIIEINLVFEEYEQEISKIFGFRLINEDVQEKSVIFGLPNGDWKIINWELYG